MTEHHSKGQLRKAGKFWKAGKEDDEGRLPGDVKLTKPYPEEGLGVGGTAVFGGYLQRREKDASLLGTRRYRTYSEAIANVSIIGAAVRVFLNMVTNASWSVVPPKDSGDEGQEMADKVDAILNDMDQPLHRIVRRLAGHRFYGFALGEWVAKRNEDGTIGFKNVVTLAQMTIERWMLENDGTMIGAIQTSPQTGKDVAIPREKLVYVVDDAMNDSPEGYGLLRHVSDPVRRLMRLQELELWGYAGDLRGIPVGRAPLAELDKLVKNKTISKSDADAMLNGLESFVKNHVKNPDLGILLDSTPYKGTGEQRTPVNVPQWAIDLLDGGNYSLEAVAAAIVRIQREIARVFGVEHLMLGENSAGSRSLSNDKTQSFGLMVDSALTEIREALERDLLKPLFELNGWDPDLMPSLKTEAQAFRSADEISAVIRDLAVAGVTLDRQDDIVNEILDLLGLSRLKPLSEIDTDLLLSAEDAQAQAMETMEATTALAAAKDDDDDDKEVEKRLISPSKGESREDFVSRFMGNAKAREEFPDASQRAAVANQRFKA
jgi:hypothetical protein